MNPQFVYVVYKSVDNGVDVWKNVQSIWLTEREAEVAEINLFLNEKNPDRVEYSWEEVEIGKDLL
jgi:hypothetical protein